MKRLFIAAIAVTATTVVFAQTSSTDTTSGTSVTFVSIKENDKTPVKLEDLPAPVKKALAGSDYEGWKPVAAYWVKSEKNPYYEIQLSRGDEKKTVNLTPEGSRLM